MVAVLQWPFFCGNTSVATLLLRHFYCDASIAILLLPYFLSRFCHSLARSPFFSLSRWERVGVRVCGSAAIRSRAQFLFKEGERKESAHGGACGAARRRRSSACAARRQVALFRAVRPAQPASALPATLAVRPGEYIHPSATYPLNKNNPFLFPYREGSYIAIYPLILPQCAWGRNWHPVVDTMSSTGMPGFTGPFPSTSLDKATVIHLLIDAGVRRNRHLPTSQSRVS